MNQQEAIFAVALTEHRYIGYVFVPYIIRLNERGTFYIPDSLVLHQDVKINEERFTNQQIELVNLIDQFSDEKLTRKFSRERSSKEFFQNTDKDYFNKNIAPYIDRKMAACVDLIKNSSTPLFLKLGKYANFYNEDRIEILPDEAETVFHFDLQPEGLSYQLTVEYNNLPVGILNRKPLFVVNDPCHMVLNHKLYRFRNVSARKLAPFIERTRLTIPSNTIDKYMKSFVLNTIKGNTVNANGFDIIMVDAAHKAIIVLETGLDLEPMLTLRFEYGSKQFLAGKKGDVEVELKVEKGGYIFLQACTRLEMGERDAWFSRNFWRKAIGQSAGSEPGTEPVRRPAPLPDHQLAQQEQFVVTGKRVCCGAANGCGAVLSWSTKHRIQNQRSNRLVRSLHVGAVRRF
jgi:hypothetical protein